MNISSNFSFHVCEEKMPDVERIILIVLSVIIGIVATIGNGLCILAFYKTPALRSITNFFLISLSASDLMVGVLGIPWWIVTLMQPVHPILVKPDRGFWITQTSSISGLSLSLVSIDRYLVIKWPLRYPTLVTKSRCYVAVLCIWLISFLMGVCRTFIKGSSDLPKFYLAANMVDFAVTFAITLFCYSFIFTQARRHKRQITAQDKSNTVNISVLIENKAAVTAAMVIGVYGITGLPKFIFLIIQLNLSTDSCGFSYFERCARWIVTVAFASPALDPLVYTFRMKLFRNFIRSTVFCKTVSQQ